MAVSPRVIRKYYSNGDSFVAYVSPSTTTQGFNFGGMSGVARNTLTGGGGNDVILLYGNELNVADGLNGDDEIRVLAGATSCSRLSGQSGNDKIYGGVGCDNIWGGSGNDLLYGDKGNDVIYGGVGNDTLDGDDGTDKLFGEDGNDTINGGRGNDEIQGGSGDDDIQGGEGADKIIGGTGDDSIDGGSGNDKIDDIGGSATISGGEGNDKIVFRGPGGNVDGDEGRDAITVTNEATTSSKKLFVDGGSGRDTIDVYGNFVHVLLSEGGDSVYLNSRHRSAELAVLTGDSSGNNVYYFNENASDKIDLSSLEESENINLRFSDNLNRVGDVFLQDLGHGNFDLFVNIGTRDAYVMHFHNSIVSTESIVL